MSGSPTVVFDGDPAHFPSTPGEAGVQGDLLGQPETKEPEEDERPSGMRRQKSTSCRLTRAQQRAHEHARRCGEAGREAPVDWRFACPRCGRRPR